VDHQDGKGQGLCREAPPQPRSVSDVSAGAGSTRIQTPEQPGHSYLHVKSYDLKLSLHSHVVLLPAHHNYKCFS
jgi:hypothetical protein